jgi:hypothetical protein
MKSMNHSMCEGNEIPEKEVIPNKTTRERKTI